jgi:hypothetical protein
MDTVIRELGKLRIGALRTACEKRGLPTSGRKDQLMARIVAADQATEQQPPAHGQRAVPHTPRVAAAPTPRVAAAAPTPRVTAEGTAAPATPSLSNQIDAPGPSIGRGAEPPNSKVAMRQTPGQTEWCLTSAVSDVGDPSHSWRWTWTKSPVRESSLDSPLLEKPLRHSTIVGRTPVTDEAPRAPKRRVRTKSPDPHRSLTLADRSSGALQAFLSPTRHAPRRRMREKSPDPHRHARGDWQSELADSPLRRLADKSSKLCAHREIGSSTLAASPEPCGFGARLAATTPGRRLWHKTSKAEVAVQLARLATPRPLPSASNEMQRDGDPSTALMMLTHRELQEMCKESNIPPCEYFFGSKAALAQRLVEAHAAPASLQCANADAVKCSGPQPDCAVREGVEAAPSPCLQGAAPERRRLSGGIPLPPSSWSVPQTLECLDAPEEPIEPAPTDNSPLQTTAPASPRQCTTAVQNSPKPAEQVTAARSPTSTWWSQVASQWPQIVANLRTTSGSVQQNMTDAPSSPSNAERKRMVGSPSVLESLNSPKRHRPASGSPSPSATRRPSAKEGLD